MANLVVPMRRYGQDGLDLYAYLPLLAVGSFVPDTQGLSPRIRAEIRCSRALPRLVNSNTMGALPGIYSERLALQPV